MWRVTVSLVTVLFLVQVKSAPDISLEDLLERLVTLEDWKRETEREVSALRETVSQQGYIIKNLESKLAIQANLTAKLQSYQRENNPDTHEHRVDTEVDYENKEQVSGSNRIRSTDYDNQLKVQRSTVSKRAIAGGVAFTAYLDHDVDIGPKQTLKFNQMITNDGSAYNIHTGIFTCPEAGVYLFSFSLGTGRQLDTLAELVVNSQQIVASVAESAHGDQDLQGSNTAVVRLNLGDVVWVEALFSNKHFEGSTGLRLTTFTGVYLYG